MSGSMAHSAGRCRQIVISPLSLMVLIVYAGMTHAASAPHIYDTSVCAPDGIALGGYDAISYHRGEQPQPGKKQYSSEQGELTYLFVSAENLQTFVDNPQQYTPTYLGWCSATLSMGRLACPDYANFKIEDGKLLLFERVGFTNGLDMWNSNPLASRKQADKHFSILTGQ